MGREWHERDNGILLRPELRVWRRCWNTNLQASIHENDYCYYCTVTVVRQIRTDEAILLGWDF